MSKLQNKKEMYLAKFMATQRMRDFLTEAKTQENTFNIVTYHVGLTIEKINDDDFNFITFKTLVKDIYGTFESPNLNTYN